jgi:hypothetical protein
MAVTNENSTEYNKATDPRTYGRLGAELTPQKIKFKRFNFTQSAAAGDANSTQNLAYFDPGRYVIFPKESLMQWSAFGAARVLDVGVSAYTAEDGTAVAVSAAQYDDNVDVSAAGVAALGSDIVAGTGGQFEIKAKTGFGIFSTVTGGTIPAAATIQGYIAYAEVGP